MSTPKSSSEDTATAVKEPIAVTEKPIRGRIPSEEPEPGFSLTPRSAPKLEGIQDFRKIWPEAIEWFGELFKALSPDSGYLGDLFSGSFRRISTYGVTSLTELENMFEQFCASIPSNFRPSLEPEISKLKGVFDFSGELLVEKMVTAIRDQVTARVTECEPLPDTNLTPKEWLAEWQGRKEEVVSFIDELLRTGDPYLYNAIESIRVWLEGQKQLIQTRYEEAANGQKAALDKLLAKAKLVDGAEERVAEITAQLEQSREDLASEREELRSARRDNERLRREKQELEERQQDSDFLSELVGAASHSLEVSIENGQTRILTDQLDIQNQLVANLVLDIQELSGRFVQATGKVFDGRVDLTQLAQSKVVIRPRADMTSARVSEEPADAEVPGQSEPNPETDSVESISVEDLTAVDEQLKIPKPSFEFKTEESGLWEPDVTEVIEIYSEGDSEESPIKGIGLTDDQDDQPEKPE
jgi:hypothetical protein